MQYPSYLFTKDQYYSSGVYATMLLTLLTDLNMPFNSKAILSSTCDVTLKPVVAIFVHLLSVL